ncbi:YciI family protein [Aquabacterium sp.]|uniref:YciI family protein n=1 Tax=Aquabacterium sp. TaxID=1872578 RepID=UPI002CDBBF71|nr:YciI family protein [Aquabacterium sp.]HSW07837.1 YciI family protein [Aquabacterium sp.]
MKYMLMIFANEKAELSATDADNQAMMAAYGAYSQALVQAGVMAGGERLRPTSAATTVRVSKGRTEVLDGPYAETKEQLGGYYVIEVKDLDQALSWAARCPGASHGTVELRPIWEM